MALPKRYYTVTELANLWGEENKDVEHCLVERTLKAFIKLKPTALLPSYKDKDGKEKFRISVIKEGLFEIVNYENIEWSDGDNCGLRCDLVAIGVRLLRDKSIYAFCGGDQGDVECGYWNRVIKPSDILITAEEVKRFELENKLVASSGSELSAPPDLCSDVGQVNSDSALDAKTYLTQNQDVPDKEKVRVLRETFRLINQEVGDLLNIGPDNSKSKSRKTTVQALYKSNFDDETWKKMHPEKKKGNR